MNHVTAKISKIEGDEFIEFVTLTANEFDLVSVNVRSPYMIREEDAVRITFKENDVELAKSTDCRNISIENKIDAVIKSYRKGEFLTEVRLNSYIGEIVSLVSTRAFEAMELEVNDYVLALIKAGLLKFEPVFGKQEQIMHPEKQTN